jgi:hypothetical protein
MAKKKAKRMAPTSKKLVAGQPSLNETSTELTTTANQRGEGCAASV